MHATTLSRRRRMVVAAAAAATALTTIVVQPVEAAPEPVTVASGFAGPLGLAVGDDGTIYVGEGFGGALTSVDRTGRRTELYNNGMDVAGVDARGRGDVVFVQSQFEPPQGEGDEFGPVVAATLERSRPNGRTTTVADLLAHEVETDPDGGRLYGFEGVDDDCLATLPPWLPTVSPAVVDSHPYAVAITDRGYAVADAAANDILFVGRNGDVRTVAVLPPVPQTITAELVDEAGLDPCLIGGTYVAEPVPTDVEVGTDGAWFVTTLPGGPGSPGSAAVWRIEPATGAVSMVTDGLTSAVDLAIAPDGTIYVAELFTNRISTVVDGTVTPWTYVPQPGAVEVSADGTVHATINALGLGSVVRFDP